jgi:eukaryotic-like serine/threonine-protein kinase
MEPTFIRSPPGAVGSSKLTADALVGTIVDGRYRLVAHVASGGMGAVFRAQHVYMSNEVALKVLRSEFAESPEVAERFRREAQISGSLEHPNIVRVNDFGRTADGMLFLAMELLEGESLRARIDRERPLSVSDALAILLQISAALAVAHDRGVVHRDLKPENVFLARQRSSGSIVKVLDFGIAKLIDGSVANLTQAGLILGTPRYIAPEQAMGAAIDARCDVYALGLLAWRMLVGRHPFDGKDGRDLLVAQARESIPPISDACPALAAENPALVRTIERACAKNPEDRFPDGWAILEALKSCASPGEAREPSPSPARSAPSTPGADPRAEGRATISERGARAATMLRAKARAPAVLVAAAVLLVAILGLWIVWRERPVARAARAIADGHADAARAILERELANKPQDPEIQVLLGRALHRTPGETASGIRAYERAFDLRGGTLDDATALEDLVRDLGRDPPFAEMASKLLARLGQEALPLVLRAAKKASGYERLRALVLLKDLHASDRVDRAQAFRELLDDEECEVKRAAARQLGDLGDPSALAKLSELAKARKHERLLGLFDQTTSACGAPEAASAIKRIKAAHPAGPE